MNVYANILCRFFFVLRRLRDILVKDSKTYKTENGAIMNLSVFSEIAPLKRVLVHKPGPELEQLTPAHLERMLFDDIPFLAGAQREHHTFVQTLKNRGISVKYLVDLIQETLLQSDVIRKQFIDDFITMSGPAAVHYQKQLTDLLNAQDGVRALVKRTIRGVTEEELDVKAVHPLVTALRKDDRFILEPVPNLYFTRDPFAVIGHGAALSRMYSASRQRETIFGRYILSYHKDYAGRVPFYYTPDMPFAIEGGDILCLGEGLLAIGISQRTTPEAIEQLSKTLFAKEDSGIDRVLAIDIPAIRAYMHLDTVFTQVDKDAFTIHPAILSSVRAFRVTPGAGGKINVKALSGKLEDILAEEMRLDKVTLIRCGGSDAIASQREQWNDGSNTLCIAPGTVVVYDRNAVTNQILRDHGLNTIEVPGSELARGRGGPRCMTMPLWREE